MHWGSRGRDDDGDQAGQSRPSPRASDAMRRLLHRWKGIINQNHNPSTEYIALLRIRKYDSAVAERMKVVCEIRIGCLESAESENSLQRAFSVDSIKSAASGDEPGKSVARASSRA